jgi:hypothetical protein
MYSLLNLLVLINLENGQSSMSEFYMPSSKIIIVNSFCPCFNSSLCHYFNYRLVLLVSLDTDDIENNSSNSSSAVACAYVAAGACLLDYGLTIATSSGSAILHFRHHVNLKKKY